MNVLSMFKEVVRQPMFKSFSEFETETLNLDKANSVEAAIQLGLRCGNLGQAFATGYRCALQSLLPQLKNNQWAAMCVTEDGGNHPKQIKTLLDDNGFLSGAKSFVTMASSAKQLIVIAKAGDSNGLPILKAVLVEVEETSEEVCVKDMPSLGMIPDISHGKLVLNDASGKVLPGDGYIDFSKRFRTLEDIHVLSAFTALILSVAFRHCLSNSILERGLFLLNFVTSNDLDESELQHLNIYQAFEIFQNLVSDFMGQKELLPASFVSDWLRDEKLFKIASKARHARREKALATIMV